MSTLDNSISIPLHELPNPSETPYSTQALITEEDASPSTNSVQQPSSEERDPKAWLAVAGSFLFLFASYGFMQTIGTVQSYLELNQLSSYTSRDIGWITGVFTSLALFLGIQIGPILDAYGPRMLGPVGCIVYAPVLFVVAECHQYWQFMLVLGIWGGTGAGILSMVGITVIGKWFNRRRGLAMGIALCGSSIGGVVMPLMLRELLPKLGWAWSIRILAFVITAVLIGGVFCLQQPLPRREGSEASETHRRKRVALNFMALTSGTFTFVTIGIAALEFAIFGVFSLLPTYATVAGFTSDNGFALVAIANATSTAGRLLPGIAGDYFGHFNVLLCMILSTAVFTGAILVPFGASSLGALYAFSALWGFGSGSFISLTPVCMGKTCETDDYGRYFGTMYFFVSFTLLLASPLGGQMLQTFGTQALAGLYVAVVMVGGICFLFARQLLYGKMYGKKGFKIKGRV
ncbi:riboflavin transporter MCH5 [Truncatella angustata]|uniref:Riboflavin transporter MCH5 n=1 Tax=Truncatella angustata TaxID=152316 RepID=A0A9P8ZZE2_9PEZI|nr:riboflavin transporter MCH5 [Truncatella angustata]KAH6654970.1 riboflavin transporter MCH5 [Truncatella angustata]